MKRVFGILLRFVFNSFIGLENGISKDQCGYYVKCIGKNCKSGCELIMTSHTYECSECKPYASAGNNWSCTREEGTGSGYASVLGVLSSI